MQDQQLQMFKSFKFGDQSQKQINLKTAGHIGDEIFNERSENTWITSNSNS
jgi:hypothetical protein